jgi:hypothetical protein
MKRLLKKIHAWFTCLFLGHRYETAAFHYKCLYHCSCCGRELLGRTLADVEPLTAEEHEMLLFQDDATEVCNGR